MNNRGSEIETEVRDAFEFDGSLRIQGHIESRIVYRHRVTPIVVVGLFEGENSTDSTRTG
jgi:hypothetical protein